MKTNDETYIAAKAILEGKMVEANGGSDPDITVWTKKGPHNYNNFLAANEDRIGKPMIDGGIKASVDKEGRNGKPVPGVIYCGAGCITFKDPLGGKVFKQLSEYIINTEEDGSGAGWSGAKNYGGDGSSIYSRKVRDFDAFVKAANISLKF